MQLNAQTFLNLAETAHRLAFVDIESMNLSADYGSFLVGVILPYGKAPEVFTISKVGRDGTVIDKFARRLEDFDCWVTYNGKRFDKKFIDTRLVVNHKRPLAKRHHLDIYQLNKSKLRLSRRSQAQLLGVLETPQSKMGVSPSVWAQAGNTTHKSLDILKKRCISDCKGLKSAYQRLRSMVDNITI
jgi:hypothetical protein